jgi:cell division septum initiation protein DivIVA
VSALENDLGYLQDSWASIHIVLDSLQNAFLVTPFQGANEQQLDELDRELGTAYDDLMVQVRQLDRSLKQLDRKISELQSTSSSASQLDR